MAPDPSRIRCVPRALGAGSVGSAAGDLITIQKKQPRHARLLEALERPLRLPKTTDASKSKKLDA